MANIYHNVTVEADADDLFAAMTTAEGLNSWWTEDSAGIARKGSAYRLFFGEGYDWSGIVTVCEPGLAFEWKMDVALEDWVGTRVGFEIEAAATNCLLRFYHRGWATESDHFRQSSYCWAQYLRLLKQYVESGITIPYEERLSV